MFIESKYLPSYAIYPNMFILKEIEINRKLLRFCLTLHSFYTISGITTHDVSFVMILIYNQVAAKQKKI